VNQKIQRARQKNRKISSRLIELKSKKVLIILVGLVFFAALAAMGAYVYLNHQALQMEPGSSKAVVLTSEGGSRKPPLAPGPKDTIALGTDIQNKEPLQGLRQKSSRRNGDPMHDKSPSSELINKDALPEINKNTLTANGITSNGGQENNPVYEVFDKEHGTSSGRGDLPVAQGKEGLPRVAIIIDDLGFDKAMAMAFSQLNPHITMAILPGSPFGRVIADRLYVRDVEIMLHLPMEPMQYPEVDPGPGALMADMSPDLLLETLRRNLDSIPHVKGVNNHMGSRLTTLSDQMRQVFTVLKKRDLFFIDSLTASHSMCGPSARLFQLSFAQRDVFLDNVQDKNYITGQLRELIQISQRHGTAIGIGHPYPVTLETLKAMLPEMQQKVNIVRASELAVTPG
jgi:polysaccharide deacetylase 2 family uncharacterized protein YibQ